MEKQFADANSSHEGHFFFHVKIFFTYLKLVCIMNTVFLVIVSCFWTSFCFPNTYLHRTEEANYPIASFNKMKREFDSIGPLASSAENPFTALIVAGGVNNSIYHVCSGSILNTPTSNLTKEFNLQTSFILTTTYWYDYCFCKKEYCFFSYFFVASSTEKIEMCRTGPRIWSTRFDFTLLSKM